MDNDIEKLISEYQSFYEKQKAKLPENFEEAVPTIPWIGDNFFNSSHHILIYASAENISDNLYKEKGDCFKFFNRHKDYWWKESKNKEIGIQPFDTDGLKLAVLIVCEIFNINIAKDITQNVAVANLSKFSKRHKNGENIDVKQKDIPISEEYLKLDLKYLTPTLIINASGKEIPLSCHIDNPTIKIGQYTKQQLGFWHLRNKPMIDTEINNYNLELSELIKKYSDQLPMIAKGKLKSFGLNLDFVRYFYYLRQQAIGAKK